MSEQLDLGQITGKHNRRHVRLERRLDASVADVWAAITEPTQLARWLASARIEPRRGGIIELNDPDHAWQMTGMIRVFDPPRVLEYDWEDRHQTSIVRFELEPQGGGTHLVLTERVLTDAAVPRRCAGWHHLFERLEQALRGEPSAGDEGRWRELLGAYERSLASGDTAA